jgi:hypothetical protein
VEFWQHGRQVSTKDKNIEDRACRGFLFSGGNIFLKEFDFKRIFLDYFNILMLKINFKK